VATFFRLRRYRKSVERRPILRKWLVFPLFSPRNRLILLYLLQLKNIFSEPRKRSMKFLPPSRRPLGPA